jgi:hypothetical protein
MAVAVDSNSGTAGYIAEYAEGGITELSFSFTNTAGNAVCIMVSAAEDSPNQIPVSSVTYNGQSFTQDWNIVFDANGNTYEFYGGHILNAATGAKTIVITTGYYCYDIKALVVSVSGASTTGITAFNKNNTDGTVTTLSTTVTSQVGDLVIGMAACDSLGSALTPSTLNGTAITTSGQVWGSYYSGAASVTVTQTRTSTGNYDFVTVGGWSIPTAATPPVPTTTQTFIELRSFTEQRRFSNVIKS